jgi:dsRNA-specific ribonuclease
MRFWSWKKPKIADSVMICLKFVDPTKLAELQRIIGRTFRSPALLAQAMTHASCGVAINGVTVIATNEALENLGDKVIGLAVNEYLQKKYPQKKEHFYAQNTAKTVENATLGEIARSLGIEKFLVTRQLAGRYAAADFFEAICGALHTDRGDRAVKKFLRKTLFPKADAIVAGSYTPPRPPSTPKPNVAVRARKKRRRRRKRNGHGRQNGNRNAIAASMNGT